MSTEPSNDHDGPGDVPRDLPRDAHLRAALRHAADAGALPPTAVADAIRHAARLAVQAPPATVAAASVAASARCERTLGTVLRGLWQSLAAPRPVWAGGAAALVVTVLTVNLWVGEPLPPAVQADGPAVSAPPVPVTTAPASPTAPAPAPAPGTLSSPSPSPSPSPSLSPSRVDRPRATPATSEARSSRNEAPLTAADVSRARAAPLPPPQAAVAPAAAEPTTPPPEQAAAPMPSAAAAGAVTTPTSPETAAPTALAKSRSLADAGTETSRMAPTPARQPAPAATTSAPTAPTAQAAPSAIPAAAPPRTILSASGAAPPRELSLATKAVGSPSPPSLTGWLRAARQDSDDPAWPMTSTQRRVLQQLDVAARGRWQPVMPPTQPTQPDGGDARVMSWRSDTGHVASLRVDHQGAHWTEPEGRSWFAPLDPAARTALLREF